MPRSSGKLPPSRQRAQGASAGRARPSGKGGAGAASPKQKSVRSTDRSKSLVAKPGSRPGNERFVRSRPLWLFLSEPGLGRIHLKELKQKKIVARSTRMKPFFLRNYDLMALPDSLVSGDVRKSRLSLHTLRCPVFGRGTISESQLDLLAGACEDAGVNRLVASLAGAKFDRKELTAWVRTRLSKRGVELSSEESERIVWLVVVDDAYYFGFPEQNYHDAPGRTAHGIRAGALPVTIAAGMAFAAELTARDVVWDPMTGSGSLLEEARSAMPGVTALGSDIDAAAIAKARDRVPGGTFQVGMLQKIDLGRTDVTLTLVNPPWEQQFTSGEGQEALLEDLLRASLKVAAPDWRAVILTPHGKALSAAARAVGALSVEQLAELKVRGLEVGLWRVRRS